MNFLKTLLLLPTVVTISSVYSSPLEMKYNTKILRVIDGDTVAIAAPYLPKPLKPELLVRIYGIDTPEKGSRAKCKAENSIAVNATNFTKQFVVGPEPQVIIYNWDKYGGRVLGDIQVNGKSLQKELIRQGLARSYYGGEKSSWCS